MTTIAIYPERSTAGPQFRAVAGEVQTVGKSPGEALDAMTARLNGSEIGTMLVVRPQLSDRFFTASQQARLQELMTRWRDARDAGTALEPVEERELEQLTSAELDAAAARTRDMLGRGLP